MDFQSAARFGERRVMVTDYDETAVEVNAKVVDEDTGEVICECESGGGGGLIEATITNDASSNDTISIIPFLVKSETASKDLPGYTTANNTPVEIAPGNSANIMISPEGFCFPFAPNTPITVKDGDAQIINTTVEGNAVLFVVIKGNCTLKYTAQ